MEKELTYEEALKKLEEIVNNLEKGELSLEHSVDLFSQGINYVKLCRGYLEKAEGKIKILIENGETDFNNWSQGE